MLVVLQERDEGAVPFACHDRRAEFSQPRQPRRRSGERPGEQLERLARGAEDLDAAHARRGLTGGAEQPAQPQEGEIDAPQLLAPPRRPPPSPPPPPTHLHAPP